MTIAEVVDLIPNKLGSFERYCIANARYLRRAGHEHILFFAGEPCPVVRQALEEAGSRVAVRCFRRLGLSDAIWLSTFALKNKVDIVHLHFYEPFSTFTLISSVLPYKVFVTFHISAALSNAPWWARTLKEFRARLLGAGVAEVFCVSEFSRQRFLANYGADAKRASVIHNVFRSMPSTVVLLCLPKGGPIPSGSSALPPLSNKRVCRISSTLRPWSSRRRIPSKLELWVRARC